MQYSTLKKNLKKHGLRVTDARMDVLELFLRSSYALSFKNLEDNLKNYDRVTLYRTLNAFIESGVIHKIPDDSGVVSYGVCLDTCGPGAHHHNHVHFKCDECGHVECLEDQVVPAIKLSGYLITDVNYLINGSCKNCLSNQT